MDLSVSQHLENILINFTVGVCIYILSAILSSSLPCLAFHFLFTAISLFSGWQLERRIGRRAKRCAEEWERSAADGAAEQGLFCVKSTWVHMNMYLPLISILDTFLLQASEETFSREYKVKRGADFLVYCWCCGYSGLPWVSFFYLLRLFLVVYFAFYCSEAHRF